MRRLATGTSFAFLILIASGCDQSADQANGGREPAAAPADPSTSSPGSVAPASAPEAHDADGHAAAGEGGQALLPIMRSLASEMTTLTHALMSDDYQTVERSAAAIAEHAPISTEELERIHTVLGPDMARFEAVDESVHVASVRLHEAAAARQAEQVIERLGELQSGCLSCHTQFRDRLLTDGGAQ